MGGIEKLIGIGIGLAFALGSMGKLPEATRWMARKAAEAQPQMISLTKLNRALMDGGKRRHAVKKQAQ